MGVLTRKQREVAQRQNLFLETARRILLESGYAGLTMERVAEAAEYSKGTVYNHFRCKEEVVAELGCRVLHGKAVFAERGAASKGETRERLVAVGEAATLFSRLYPEDIRIMQILQSQVLMRKVPQKLRERIRAQDRRALNAVAEVVRDAVKKGNLPEDRFAGPPGDELAFGICCVIDGGHSKIARYTPAEDSAVADPHRAVARTLDLLADGCGWRLLSRECNYDEVRERVRSTVFHEELRRLNATRSSRR